MTTEAQGNIRILPKRLLSFGNNFLNGLANLLIKLKFTPNSITVLALLIGLGAGVLFAFGYPVWGGIAIILCGIFDVMDGKVAVKTNRKSLFGVIHRLVMLAERKGNYVLLSRKEKKIKHQAERVASGEAYLPDTQSDHRIIEKAEGERQPFLIREKNNYVLACPLVVRNRFVGCVCVADRMKKEIDARMPFYRLVAEIIPVVDLQW